MKEASSILLMAGYSMDLSCNWVYFHYSLFCFQWITAGARLYIAAVRALVVFGFSLQQRGVPKVDVLWNWNLVENVHWCRSILNQKYPPNLSTSATKASDNTWRPIIDDLLYVKSPISPSSSADRHNSKTNRLLFWPARCLWSRKHNYKSHAHGTSSLL